MASVVSVYFACNFIANFLIRHTCCYFKMFAPCSIVSLSSYAILDYDVGLAGSVVPMLEAVMAVVPAEKLAVHFHDTYGQSLPNILISLQV